MLSPENKHKILELLFNNNRQLESVLLSNFPHDLHQEVRIYLDSEKTRYTTVERLREGNYWSITLQGERHLKSEGGPIQESFYKDKPIELAQKALVAADKSIGRADFAIGVACLAIIVALITLAYMIIHGN
jgi:hypothetical protein